MNPIVRWAGSKRKLLSKLKMFWPGGGTRYVEPFCGSACLFFDLEPEEAVLGDLNSELITAYEVLRRNISGVCDYLRHWSGDEQTYYNLRSLDPENLNETEKAARFLYLNKHCFNGIYRTNRSGRFNVPRGTRPNKTTFDYEQIATAANLLNRVILINGDFEMTIQQVRQGDFVYLDPPYAVADRQIFAEYHPDTFMVQDLARLERNLHEINEKGAAFVISYADSREARELLGPWRPRRVWTRRHIAGFACDRRGAYELLATNIATYVE